MPAVDQGDVQLPFQLGDRRGQRGLGDVALLGRPGSVALAGDRDEILQLPEKHPHLLGLTGTDPAEKNGSLARQPSQRQGRVPYIHADRAAFVNAPVV